MPSELIVPGLVEPQGRGEEPLYYFTRIYLLFLQGLFKQFPTGSYKWTDDEKLTEIVITDQVPIPRERIEQRPAIVSMRGPAQFANMTLDQMRTVDSHTGMKERTDLVACTMSLSCIAKNGVEAQRLGWIIMTHLRRFKELLQQNGFHKIGDDVNIGPESPPGAMIQGEVDTEFVMVTVQSPFFFQWTERVTPADAIKLREIELHMQSALLPAVAVTTQAHEELIRVSPPSIRGRALRVPPTEQQRVGEITQTVKT